LYNIHVGTNKVTRLTQTLRLTQTHSESRTTNQTVAVLASEDLQSHAYFGDSFSGGGYYRQSEVPRCLGVSASGGCQPNIESAFIYTGIFTSWLA
jgi:hypothetical protein